MHRTLDQAVVLRRVNYADSDRVLTLLTKEHGKITVFAKGVRKQKSRLSGGVEPLCVSEISFIKSKSDLKTLTGAHLKSDFTGITKNLESVNLVYDLISKLDKICEEGSGQEFFDDFVLFLKHIETEKIDPLISRTWIDLAVMRKFGVLARFDVEEKEGQENYVYDPEKSSFVAIENGEFSAWDIKLIKLLSATSKPVSVKNDVQAKLVQNFVKIQLEKRLL